MEQLSAIEFKASQYNKIFWLEALRRPKEEQVRYHLYGLYHYKICPDISRLKDSLQRVVDNNYNLRSNYKDKNGELFQIIHGKVVVDIENYVVNDKNEYEKLIRQKRFLPFSLADDRLFRFVYVHNKENSITTFMPIFHHIIIDGTQFDSLMERISYYYHNTATQDQSDEKNDIENLKAYIKWEQEQIDKADINYWLEKLKEFPRNIDLPYRTQVIDKNEDEEIAQLYNLNEEMYKKLQDFSEKTGFSIFDIFKTVFALLVSQYSNQPKIVISYPFNSRRKNFKDVKGAYLNTWLYPFERKGTFLECLIEQKKNLRFAHHRYVNIVDIISNIPGAFFPVSISQSDLSIKGPVLDDVPDYSLQPGLAGTDLCLFLNFTETNLQYVLVATKKLFTKESLARFNGHFNNLLTKVLENPDINLSSVTCLTNDEYKQIVYKWNDNCTTYPENKTIYQLFEEQVINQPKNIAIEFNDIKLTYEDLNKKANQLARYIRKEFYQLHKKEIAADTLIPIYVEQSIDFIIGTLGILKSGAAYVPIDVSSPSSRVHYMLNDINSSLILTKHKLGLKISEIDNKIKLLLIDKMPFYNEDSNNLHCYNNFKDLAYVIYTSGTTGDPKGVMVEHKNVISLVNNVSYFIANSSDAFGLFSDTAFDAATFEIWGALLNGAKLVIPDNRLEILSSSHQLKEFIDNNNVTILWLTKTLFDFLFTLDETLFCNLRYLIVGGEALNKNIVSKLINSKYKPRNLINGYGPTENTTFSCTYNISDEINSLVSIPIGRPLSNRQCYVLDCNLNPVPVGVIGELYVGGAGISRGYLNQYELTRKKFINNPFSLEDEKDNVHLYKTDDLVKWLPDGNLEYMGRNDSQVKLRGYRIELGEIEAKLLNYNKIKQCVVLLKDEKEHKYLVTYYVSEKKLTEEEIYNYLATELPDYMLPSFFVHLEKLPYTANGKLDVQALLKIKLQQETNIYCHEEVQDIEKLIRKTWSDILGRNDFRRDESFFNLGGNSLALMKVRKELESQLKIKMNIVELFQHTTLRQLSEYVSSYKILQSNVFDNKVKIINAHIEDPVNEPIAVIGMACRVPEAKDTDSLWEMLLQGKSNIRDFSKDELHDNNVINSLSERNDYVKRGAILENIYCFDANFFGYSAKDAELMDPQQRHFLECVWEALEYSGNVPEKFSGEIGVFASQGKNYYFLENVYPNLIYADRGNDYQAMLGNEKDFLSTRVSYKLNLLGPSFTIQTGCSSSLVAIQTACESLKHLGCDMAIAGGVSFFYRHGYLYQEGMIESPDGYCKAFDAEAEGTIANSGVGVVVLKRLSDAINQQDTIYAVIKGGAINNDGAAKISYTAPSIQGQTSVIEKALKNAKILPQTISYIEAHGTGTPLGDPIEWAALHRAYEKYTTLNNFCTIGTIKTNIGHTDSAAGVMGLIKTVLSLRNKIIPATLNFKLLNPEIAAFNKLFQVSNQTTHWVSDHVRRAAVSSFGIGGTNAHVILEEYNENNTKVKNLESNDEVYTLVPFSAKTQKSLTFIAQKLKHYIGNVKEVAAHENIAFTFQQGRSEMQERGYFIIGKNQAITPHYQPNVLHEHTRIILNFPECLTIPQLLYNHFYNKYEHFKKSFDECKQIILENYGSTLEILQQQRLEAFSAQYALAQQLIKIIGLPYGASASGFGYLIAGVIIGSFSLTEALHIAFLWDGLTEEVISTIQFKVPTNNVILTSTSRQDEVDEEKLVCNDYWFYLFKNISLSSAKICDLKISESENNNLILLTVGSNIIAQNQNSNKHFLELIGKLWMYRSSISWDHVNKFSSSARKISLPTYAFAKESYCIAKPAYNKLNSQQRPFPDKNVSLEQSLKKIWSDVLGAKNDDINHSVHFFDLGGDSIAFLDLLAGIKKTFSINIELDEIIQYYKFNDMLKLIDSKINCNVS